MTDAEDAGSRRKQSVAPASSFAAARGALRQQVSLVAAGLSAGPRQDRSRAGKPELRKMQSCLCGFAWGIATAGVARCRGVVAREAAGQISGWKARATENAGSSAALHDAGGLASRLFDHRCFSADQLYRQSPGIAEHCKGISGGHCVDIGNDTCAGLHQSAYVSRQIA